MNMKKQQGNQPLDFSGGLVDLECFLAWSERIKLDMSKSNPLLYEVLGRLASSKHPIAGGDSFQTVSAEASFLQGMSHQHSGADKEKEARELQISSEGRQLGCLLVQRTKGETQLKVTKWLVATNGWEAWRQLNLSFLSRLLNSLSHTSFEDTPASCLQQLSAWKERVVIYQELSGEQLPESVMISVVLSGLKEKTRHFLPLHLDGDSSFGALGNLLAIYFSMREEQEYSLNMIMDAACTEKKEKEELGEHNRGDYQENSSFQQEQEQDKRKLVKGGKGKGQSTKEKGGAYNPQPPAYRGKGEPNQLPDSAQRACRDKRQKWETRTKKRKRRSLPSPASSLLKQGKAKAASYTRALVQRMPEERASNTSLLVEQQQPARAKAPKEESLAQPNQKEAASKRQWRPIFC